MPFSICQNIALLQKRLREVVSPEQGKLNSFFLHPLSSEGKYIRPRLVMLCNSLFSPIDEKTMDVAVAIECIHIASLVHDDIIDNAKVRRGIPSVNHLYGAKAAVLVGDQYFASAFELVARHRLDDVLEELCRAIKKMCQGEMKQNLSLFNPNLTEKGYFENIYGKTASLFVASCRAGAMAADAGPGETDKLSLIGEKLGQAYQIVDDIMDFIGDQKSMGKTPGGDLSNGVITLPVIRTLSVSKERDWLYALINSRRIGPVHLKRVIELIIECGAFKYAVEAAVEKITAAKETICQFPSCQARKELLDLCASLVNIQALKDFISDLERSILPDEGNAICSLYQQAPGFTGI